MLAKYNHSKTVEERKEYLDDILVSDISIGIRLNQAAKDQS